MFFKGQNIQVENIEVKIRDEIGKGGYGIVYQAQRPDGNVVALKTQESITDHEKQIF